MSKSYTDYSDAISADELYEGLLAYGLFSEKLPPIFTSEEFFKYSLSLPQPFSKKDHGYIFFESMRDINVPRALGIPHPMAYQRLCECLRDNWSEIQRHFHDQTDYETHKISRIHIRKRYGSKALFKMNYKNWRTDDSPIPDLLIGKRYMVSADISTCFPSMYTHALCWALVGKQYAKDHRNGNLWFNKIDHRCMEIKSGETHGFLIGPHASNLLSEIILTVVDRQLDANGWKYIRNIDDYTCYVESYERAQQFLTQLAAELRKFDLPLNHKKTKIEELPVASTKHWVRQLNAFDFSSTSGKTNYKKAQAYLDAAVGLMEDNGNNAAVLNYAIKVLSKQLLTNNAKEYSLKTILHFSYIFPYIIPLLDENVFQPFDAQKAEIARFTQIIYNNALQQENFEALIYALFFSIKYDFDIVGFNVDSAIHQDSCLLKLFSWIYCYNRNDSVSMKKLEDHAEVLAVNEFDQYWLFIFEVLPAGKLTDEWKPMKTAGISFIRSEYKK